ncbi:flagellar assembly protein FliW [Arthrobacter gengyunqii]|uniref:Flagellar assembly protein FliW n=1 Tax=Arthrobacter gengyunqii TaxID=2886940 RepID=A0A9X1M3W5_9MICC|nr:flagellar assembly protein FliW [Arthrobacter gengyunqii]MCC3270948.1 flagellar assembly protein FliW [Arthrobacter gengyunqii]UOY96560.1 flagellar assembly protein FliW [Arthrobacter gengyunqii]
MSVRATFLTPPPGFAPEVNFLLSAVDGADGLYSLKSAQSGDAEGLRLFVLDAAVYLPGYQPEISDDQRLQLDLADAAEARVLVVANSTEEGTTVNLLAPIVLNTRTLHCTQVILDGQDWPVRIPLEEAAV